MFSTSPINTGGSPGNESKPVVSGSSPHGLEFYPSPGSSHPTPIDDGADPEIDIPEGPWRRIWELRLLHNYQTMAQPFPGQNNPELARIWEYDIPDLAMRMAHEHNRCSLLYITLANSALHLWARTTDKRERDDLMKLQQTYQVMCMKGQRRDLEELTQGIIHNADYICFTSLRILAHSIALVQTLSVDPWEAPVQWLHMGRGAGEVIATASGLLSNENKPTSYLNVMSNSNIRNPQEFLSCDHSSLDWLLEYPGSPMSMAAQDDYELHDEEARSVYDKALSYICNVQRSIDMGETDATVARRLAAFSIVMPREFTRFIEERRPRAMVVLAHFMSLWIDYEHIWLIGKAGEWQIRGVYKALPIEWSYKLDGLFSKFKQPEAGR